MDWTKVEEALTAAAVSYPQAIKNVKKVQHYAFPGAVLLVGKRGRVVFHKAVGCRSVTPEVTPMTEDMVFDIASLTKPIITTLVMQLVDSGQISVDQRLSRIFQTFGTHGKEQMTVRHLLAHCSGYPATAPYHKQIAQADRGDRAGVMTSRAAADIVCNEILSGKAPSSTGQGDRIQRYWVYPSWKGD